MKNKTIVLVCFIFCITMQALLAQQESSRFTLGIIPTSLLDPITPSLGLSAEVQVIPKLNVELIYGFDTNWDLNIFNRHPAKKFRHHEYKMAIKYFINLSEEHFNNYLGLEYFGVYNPFEKEDDYYRDGEIYYGYKSAQVKRVIHGGRFKLGRKVVSKNKLFEWDLSSGVGVRRIQVEFISDNKTILNEIPRPDWIFVPVDSYAGVRHKLDLSLAVKVSYCFY